MLPDGRPWFTMTEVQGAAFSELLSPRSRSLQELVEVLIRVAEVIAFIEATGGLAAAGEGAAA